MQGSPCCASEDNGKTIQLSVLPAHGVDRDRPSIAAQTIRWVVKATDSSPWRESKSKPPGGQGGQRVNRRGGRERRFSARITGHRWALIGVSSGGLSVETSLKVEETTS